MTKSRKPRITDFDLERELERINVIPDEAIDFSDIPLVIDWSGAARGRFYRPGERIVLPGGRVIPALEPARSPVIRTHIENPETDMADPHNPATAEADADAQAYLRGSQEINEQTATFDLVMGLLKWGSLAIACMLVWLTIWFMPNGNLFAGFITALVMAVAGFFFLKSPKKTH